MNDTHLWFEPADYASDPLAILLVIEAEELGEPDLTDVLESELVASMSLTRIYNRD